jgi:hypothetical protein
MNLGQITISSLDPHNKAVPFSIIKILLLKASAYLTIQKPNPVVVKFSVYQLNTGWDVYL